jgi:pilus assembly protein CpaE
VRLLEVACQVYGAVVVDLPRIRQPWTLDVLAGSDEVCVISELTVPALLRRPRLVGEIEADLDGGKQARLVVNRLASRVFGPCPRWSRPKGAAAESRRRHHLRLGGRRRQRQPGRLDQPAPAQVKIVQDVKRLVDRLISEADRGSSAHKGAA